MSNSNLLLSLITKVSRKDVKSMMFISPLKIKRLKNSPSLVRTFSRSNFTSCECHLILSYMYKKLQQHYKGSQQWIPATNAAIRYVRICIRTQNYAAAQSCIDEAVNILKNEELETPLWKTNLYLGKLCCLQGVVLVRLDALEEGRKKFLEAMKYFEFPFPENKKNLRFHLKLLKKKIRQKIGLYFLPKSFITDEDDIDYLFIANSISETLSHLCRVYIEKDEWKLAEMAAVWGLTSSLQSETSLIRICESFTNMMIVARHYRNRLFLLSLEVHALRYCHKKINFVEVPEIRAVSRLYAVIFDSRVARVELESALQIAYVAIQLSTTSNEIATTIQLFVLLLTVVLQALYAHEAVSIMRELEFYSDEIENHSGRTWYYALCITFHLETGYIIVPINAVEIFFNGEGIQLDKRHYDAKMRLIITMWVWYLRCNRWEAAAVLIKEIEEYRNIRIENNYHAITHLYLLEGTLLTLVYRINKRNIRGVEETRKKVDKLFKKLYKCASFCSFVYGRLYHLQAYLACISNNEDKRTEYLKKARKFCLKHENKLELLHLDHSEKAWKNEITATLRDFWKNHCTSDSYVTLLEMDYDNLKIYCFTYPVPHFKH